MGAHGEAGLTTRQPKETAAWVGLPYLGLALVVLVGDRRGKNIVQITGAKRSTLPRPCQRQATGCSNSIKTKLSGGHAET